MNASSSNTDFHLKFGHYAGLTIGLLGLISGFITVGFCVIADESLVHSNESNVICSIYTSMIIISFGLYLFIDAGSSRSMKSIGVILGLFGFILITVSIFSKSVIRHQQDHATSWGGWIEPATSTVNRDNMLLALGGFAVITGVVLILVQKYYMNKKKD